MGSSPLGRREGRINRAALYTPAGIPPPAITLVFALPRKEEMTLRRPLCLPQKPKMLHLKPFSEVCCAFSRIHRACIHRMGFIASQIGQ